MNKRITIYLGIFGVALLAIIGIFGRLPGGNSASKDPYYLTTRPAQTATPALSQLVQVFPSPTPTADLSRSQNCTYTDYFWQDHPAAWPDQVEIAGQTIDKSRAAQLLQAPDYDPVLGLQRAYYVALLNIQAGADRAKIDKTIQNATDWLVAHPSTDGLSSFDKTVGTLLILTLENYNNGTVGPALCPNQPRTPPSAAASLLQAQLAQTQSIIYATPGLSQAIATYYIPPILPATGATSTPVPSAQNNQPSAPTVAPGLPSPTLSSSATPPTPSRTLTPTPIQTPTASGTPTSTFTPQPSETPTDTGTPRPTRTPTSTPLPPNDTPTYTPTPRPTRTPTPLPPTDTPTPVPPSPTPTMEPPKPTHTPKPPKDTSTPVPTATPTLVPATATPTPQPPTDTATLVPPSDTPTPVPPADTPTPLPPTDAPTPVPPTQTATLELPTSTSPPDPTSTPIPTPDQSTKTPKPKPTHKV